MSLLWQSKNRPSQYKKLLPKKGSIRFLGLGLSLELEEGLGLKLALGLLEIELGLELHH